MMFSKCWMRTKSEWMHVVREVSWGPIVKGFIHHTTDCGLVFKSNTQERLLLKIELGFQQHSGQWDRWQGDPEDEQNQNEPAPKDSRQWGWKEGDNWESHGSVLWAVSMLRMCWSKNCRLYLKVRGLEFHTTQVFSLRSLEGQWGWRTRKRVEIGEVGEEQRLRKVGFEGSTIRSGPQCAVPGETQRMLAYMSVVIENMCWISLEIKFLIYFLWFTSL